MKKLEKQIIIEGVVVALYSIVWLLIGIIIGKVI